MGGCDVHGNLNQENFSAPMPWIGIYVAAASLACLIAMAADVVHGFRHWKLWFPSKFFSINATSLTLIGVAVKLSVDLNTAMPSRQDQLAKLSSSVLICTVMGNSMPSLGSMENKEIMMNIIAFGILVITLIVNICIQLATGAIFVFCKEHVFIMFIMLILLIMMNFSALTIPVSKRSLEHKYNKRYQLALKEGINETDKRVASKLKGHLMKHWMMAHTSSPQFVMGRSATCTASGAICLLSTMILAEAMLRTYLMPWSFTFCRGESDYKWSTTLVLATQTIAVAVGTIGPASRWFIAINFRCAKRGNTTYKGEFKIEKYWTQRLRELKECPLSLIRFKTRHSRKLAHDTRNKFLDLCIGMQTGNVIMSKAIRLISIFFVSRILLCCDFCKQWKKKFKFDTDFDNSGPESQPNQKLDLSCYVLHLEGEDALVEHMMRSNCDATDHWFQRGKKREPKYIVKLLEKSTFSQGFKGVADFDSEKVPCLDLAEPPNSWALPVVTLTSIALALPNISSCSIKELIGGVHEGIMYINFIENFLDSKEDVTNIRKTADMVWLGVDLYHTWLDVDLRKLSLHGKSSKEILEGLAETAKFIFEESKKKQKTTNVCLRDTPSKWPVKELAANSMYRISETLLLNYEGSLNQTGERLFEALTVMISDILAACLTNMKQVIKRKCLNSTIEEREESVRHAVCILGKTENILNILGQKIPPSMDPRQISSIDEWRLLHKMESPLAFPSSSPSEGDTASSVSSDFYVIIE